MSRFSSLCIKPNGRFVIRLLLPLLATVACVAAEHPTTQVVPFSKERVEQVLQHLQSGSGGRLPTLYGFVIPGIHPLESYLRGYYQYDIKVTSIGATTSSVQIVAKITAWYSDENPSQSSYQLLASNGRLESDLLDQLENELKPAAPSTMSTAMPTEKTDSRAEILPDAPSITKANQANPASRTQPNLAVPSPSLPKIEKSADDRIRRLTREAKALREIRDSQTKPNDLAVVVASKTPVLARPAKDAETILLADTDDELQVIDMDATWVHVQLLGPSRGWVRRSQLDVSGVSVQARTSKPSPPANVPLFRKTREETAIFPGRWEPLNGKKVRIVWVEPSEEVSHNSQKSGIRYLQSLLRQQYTELSASPGQVAGVVVVLDSEDGGMVAATTSSLQHWNAGSLSDQSFLKQCWFDPMDVFQTATVGR